VRLRALGQAAGDRWHDEECIAICQLYRGCVSSARISSSLTNTFAELRRRPT